MPKGSAHFVIQPMLKNNNVTCLIQQIIDPLHWLVLFFIKFWSTLHCIVTCIEHLITTISNQFGFKKSHSTLKDLVSFYHDHESIMYVAFVDASKGFDHLNYTALICKLYAKDVPGVIL